MADETFAEYILNETDLNKKLEIMFFLKRSINIYYNNAVIFKTLLTHFFVEYLKTNYTNYDLDENLIVTARLLCDCKKVDNSTNYDDIQNYARKGAKYLSKLGFNDRFCRICEGVNRYTIKTKREPESDIIELTDQFGGMLIDRPERIGMEPSDALTLLQYKNMQKTNNMFLDSFISFIKYLQNVDTREVNFNG